MEHIPLDVQLLSRSGDDPASLRLRERTALDVRGQNFGTSVEVLEVNRWVLVVMLAHPQEFGVKYVGNARYLARFVSTDHNVSPVQCFGFHVREQHVGAVA